MEVLLWLVPTGVATALAMAWAGWVGRRSGRDVDHDRRRARDDEQARARLGAALSRPLPARARRVVDQPVERGTGVAMRGERLGR